MDIKKLYYLALVENKGQLNEIDLGEKFGLNQKETRKLIAVIIAEHKIEYVENRTCSYRINKSSKEKRKI